MLFSNTRPGKRPEKSLTKIIEKFATLSKSPGITLLPHSNLTINQTIMKNIIVLGALLIGSVALAHDREVILVIDNSPAQLEKFTISDYSFEKAEISITLPEQTNVWPAEALSPSKAIQSKPKSAVPSVNYLRPPPLLNPHKFGYNNSITPRVSSYLLLWQGNERS